VCTGLKVGPFELKPHIPLIRTELFSLDCLRLILNLRVFLQVLLVLSHKVEERTRWWSCFKRL